MKDTKQLKNLATNQDFRVANTLTNIAYIICDVADSAIMDAEPIYYKLGEVLRHEEKMKFKRMAVIAKQLKQQAQYIASQVYSLNDAEDALQDADDIYALIKCVCNHFKTDRSGIPKIIRYIRRYYPLKSGEDNLFQEL